MAAGRNAGPGLPDLGKRRLGIWLGTASSKCWPQLTQGYITRWARSNGLQAPVSLCRGCRIVTRIHLHCHPIYRWGNRGPVRIRDVPWVPGVGRRRPALGSWPVLSYISAFLLHRAGLVGMGAPSHHRDGRTLGLLGPMAFEFMLPAPTLEERAVLGRLPPSVLRPRPCPLPPSLTGAAFVQRMQEERGAPGPGTGGCTGGRDCQPPAAGAPPWRVALVGKGQLGVSIVSLVKVLCPQGWYQPRGGWAWHTGALRLP